MRRSLLAMLGTLFILLLLLVLLTSIVHVGEWIAFGIYRARHNYARYIQSRKMYNKLNAVPFSKRVPGTYLAPLYACDSERRIPDEYIVFLHQGYPLEDHKRVVGDAVDWDDAIRHSFPETERHGLHYSATLPNSSLSAVRGNVRVDMVECEETGFLIVGIVTLREDARRLAEMGYVLTYRGERVDPNSPGDLLSSGPLEEEFGEGPS